MNVYSLSNAELEEMGLEVPVFDEADQEEFEAEEARAKSRCCSDPLCPCPKF